MFHLIPAPKEISYGSSRFALDEIENLSVIPGYSPGILNALLLLADDFEKVTCRRLRFAHSGLPGKAVKLNFTPGIRGDESYRMTGNADGITLEAAGECGIFYAIQSLRQIVALSGNIYPEFTISDAPDFAVRGFYHDISRGNVPTFETLCRMADRLAYYKINQFQLYIEHTFAFAGHCDIWQGCDPLTAEEVIKLDHYCRERMIDLVPSISTFGHFYTALRSPRKEHLNILPLRAGEKPYSMHDRMVHYTLDPRNPRSLKLLEGMLGEFLPLFSSKYCNICCDETFDLTGMTAADGDPENLRAYMDFVKKITGIVKSHGKNVMLWADVIGKNPELFRELPDDSIALEWDYDENPVYRDTAKLSANVKHFYVCPGCGSHDRAAADIFRSCQNILKYAQKGRKYGADGVLNTNWGDHGTINLWGGVLYPAAYGAAAAWNVDGAEDIAGFDSAFEKLELGCEGFTALWRRYFESERIGWAGILSWASPEDAPANLWQRIYQMSRADISALADELSGIVRELKIKAASAAAADPLTMPELINGFEFMLLMHRIAAAVCHDGNGADAAILADQLRKLEYNFSKLWHRRSRPSEYFRLKEVMLEIALKLDRIAISPDGTDR